MPRPRLLAKLATTTLVLAAVPLNPQAVVQDPRPDPQPAAIGELVPDLPFVDLRALRRRLSELAEGHALVLVFVTVDCPMVGRVLPEFGRIAAEQAASPVRFAAVNVGRSDSIRAMGTQAIELDQPYPFVKDEGARLAAALGVERTTTCVVLDRERRLRYRGRIDDRVRFARARAAPSRADLRLAIASVLAGTRVEIAETEVDGCAIEVPRDLPPATTPTFHRDVEPLIQRHCQDCHHDEGVAPFPLIDYDDVVDHAAMIVEVLERGRMPPWHASDRHGEFRNRRGLTADERRTIVDWRRSGAVRGDPADAPEPRSFPTGPWRIGEPDLVLKLPAPIRLPADGIVPYQYHVFPFRFREETWVEAVEILPDNPRVLHHANLAWFDASRGWDPDGFITGFVPGGDPLVLDPGTAMRIPAGSVLGIQTHYVTTGRAEVDRLRVGLRFPRCEITRRAEVLVITDTRFAIPPGAAAHRVAASRRVAEDSTVIGMFAHMHLRGRDMTFVAHPPPTDDAEPRTLLMIPNYDFDWQASYRCHEGALRLPAGTRVEVIAHFDNSAFNPFNPDPGATVRFGQQTFEEMMYGFVFLTPDAARPGLRVDPRTGHLR